MSNIIDNMITLGVLAGFFWLIWATLDRDALSRITGFFERFKKN